VPIQRPEREAIIEQSEPQRNAGHEGDGDAQRRAEEAADSLYRADLASRTLGIEIEEVAPGSATGALRIAQTMVNGLGLAHGGYLFLLADTVLAFAAQTRGDTAVSWHADMTFIAPAHAGERVTAKARERARYGRSAIYDVDVHAEDGRLVGEMRGHVRILKVRQEDVAALPLSS
jgi:acyl-CoA thioesterase